MLGSPFAAVHDQGPRATQLPAPMDPDEVGPLELVLAGVGGPHLAPPADAAGDLDEGLQWSRLGGGTAAAHYSAFLALKEAVLTWRESTPSDRLVTPASTDAETDSAVTSRLPPGRRRWALRWMPATRQGDQDDDIPLIGEYWGSDSRSRDRPWLVDLRPAGLPVFALVELFVGDVAKDGQREDEVADRVRDRRARQVGESFQRMSDPL